MDEDEDVRTLWCGNLSEKVTEDILYELFLQSGPVQRVTIPKDREGRQRAFGFVTFKHANSVPYAMDLFDGTTLFNRPLNIKARNNSELPKLDKQPHELYNPSNLLLMGHQMLMGNFPPNVGANMLVPNPHYARGQSQLEVYSHQESHRYQRKTSYSREHERGSKSDRKDYDDRKDHRSYRRNNDYRSSEHSRHNSYKSHRHSYR